VTHSLTKLLCLLLVLVFAQSWAAAQDLDFHAPANASDNSVPGVMRDLAGRMLPVYQDNNQERFLSNLSAIQMVAGDYKTAYATRQSLNERRRNADAGRPPGRATVYDLYVRARAIEADARVPFNQAFTLAFRGVAPRLEDRDAYVLIGLLSTPVSEAREGLQRAFDRVRSKNRISMQEAVDLIWAYFTYDAYRNFAQLINGLDAEESRRRYVVENVMIKTTGGASIAAVVVRPKLLKKMPALLEFSIEEAQIDGKEAASHGYVGVMAYARGTHGSPGEATPFLNDDEDARAAINWITKQAWSNGSVGMYGGGYSGYTAFAVAKRPLPALKGIATSDPTAPGIDFPMSGNIFRNSAYRWTFRVMNNPREPDKIFDDDAQWRAFNQAWYTSGKSYREFASLPGPHTTVFQRWLNHPSYDQFWSRLMPSQQQFANIKIPVLTTTGYFADGLAGALAYYNQHYRANKEADHTLLIGPYDENAMQRGPAPVLRGYPIAQVAAIDLRELRYQWFDFVMKGGAKPALLKDRVNYQVMGTNEWRSAPSLEEVGTGSLRFYLEPTEDPNARNRLLETKNEKLLFAPQTFDFEDREDVKTLPSSAVITRNLQPLNGELYVSEPLPQPVEVNGVISGLLDLYVNKMDIDIQLALYELLPNGDYVALFEPTYAFRASYARSHANRRLLKSGVRQQLPFKLDLITSRELQAGSRVVLVLGINKRYDQQLNYGTGKDVSEESIAHAKRPLRTRYYNSSYIELPFNK
jgi:uncharacterized protein